MYNQRRQQLQAQILQPDDIDTPQYGTASVDTSVKPTTTTTTVITASTQVPNFVSLKQVELDIKTKKRIPKNTSFEPLSELASQNFRDLLTREYRGNYPNKIILKAIHSDELVPSQPDSEWVTLIEPTSVGPHGLFYFDLPQTDKVFTHAKIIIVPDGGIKRLRLYGVREGGKVPPTPIDIGDAATL
ncbi:Putative Allantoicase [Rhizopus microsporus]|nr:Putative Allantoicase [Rhizopus microsporus]